jgi:ABC-type siderophore export system fused ATPase/permease subunit
MKSIESIRSPLSGRLVFASFLVIGVWLSISSAYADNQLSDIQVSSRLDFNAILITEVDLVFVFDQRLADQLPTLKGQWYSQKYDLMRDGTSGLTVITISAPQGFDSANVNLPEQSTQAVRIFAAGYHEAQETPVHDLTGRKRVLVEIDEFGLLVSEQAP